MTEEHNGGCLDERAYPPLPKPNMVSGMTGLVYFGDDQMRAYVDADRALRASLSTSKQAGAELEGYLLWDRDDPNGYAECIYCPAENGDPAHKPGRSDYRGHVWVSKPVYSLAAPGAATNKISPRGEPS